MLLSKKSQSEKATLQYGSKGTTFWGGKEAIEMGIEPLTVQIHRIPKVHRKPR